MAVVVTAQVLNRYYDEYKDTEITFSKEIMRTLKMDPRQIYIKSGGLQWPCIINSTTFNIAKIIIGTKSGAYQVLSKREPAPVSLRFSFYQPDGQLMSFFVSARVQICQPYMNSSELAIVQLQYTQRPPDDLIQMIGNLLDANVNAVKRKEDRIIINQDSMRRLGISKKEMVISIQNVPRHCILQDLSFGGAKIVLMGLAQYLLNKEVQLQLEFDDPHEYITLNGVVVGANFIEGRKDIIVASIKFAEESISLAYKIHINKYITSVRKSELDNKFGEDVPETATPVGSPAKTSAAPAAAPEAQPAQEQNSAPADSAPAN
ncbi:PilZN3 domain-containing protein [Treponema sp.]|uniref:PilZN3 domain-containing protein n=1 Tax=Treponema sp. TaxID=166 RepID=UPI00388F35D2